MKRPEYVRGQAFLFILGGDYCESAITYAIIKTVDVCGKLLDMTFFDKTNTFNEGWTFNKKDVRWTWADSPALDSNPMWPRRIQRSINEHGGAWVFRVYAK